MQTPITIDFQNLAPTSQIRDAVNEHVTELESRYGRVTDCRVVVKAPGEHHRAGGLYEINIRLGLPGGRAVNVTDTPQADERHSDLAFAIANAFKRARRQLQDEVRRMRGDVKHHEAARDE